MPLLLCYPLRPSPICPAMLHPSALLSITIPAKASKTQKLKRPFQPHSASSFRAHAVETPSVPHNLDAQHDHRRQTNGVNSISQRRATYFAPSAHRPATMRSLTTTAFGTAAQLKRPPLRASAPQSDEQVLRRVHICSGAWYKSSRWAGATHGYMRSVEESGTVLHSLESSAFQSPLCRRGRPS
ncbi:hypothetical protein EJ06DRAFT_301081 [Trichodelitschia bisporula]|uniref:Uncharacterized protein n=1 Tax=Trichodelitschia bisporula TaxID=703511 RepID=A0A6G1I709_9PEZI|nr:hypothetical protein EJ06DRAFT_301081 [Trichodelitschia bisporula]